MAAFKFGSSFLSEFCADSSCCLGVIAISSIGRLENLDSSHMSINDKDYVYYKKIGYNIIVFPLILLTLCSFSLID